MPRMRYFAGVRRRYVTLTGGNPYSDFFWVTAGGVPTVFFSEALLASEWAAPSSLLEFSSLARVKERPGYLGRRISQARRWANGYQFCNGILGANTTNCTMNYQSP